MHCGGKTKENIEIVMVRRNGFASARDRNFKSNGNVLFLKMGDRFGYMS